MQEAAAADHIRSHHPCRASRVRLHSQSTPPPRATPSTPCSSATTWSTPAVASGKASAPSSSATASSAASPACTASPWTGTRFPRPTPTSRSLARHPYTRHTDDVGRRMNELSSQRITVGAEGETAGVGQAGIPVHAGWTYEGRLVIDTPTLTPVHLRLIGRGGRVARRQDNPGGGAGWQTVEFTFTPTRTTEDARLEITLAQQGEVFLGAVSLLPAGHFHGMRRRRRGPAEGDRLHPPPLARRQLRRRLPLAGRPAPRGSARPPRRLHGDGDAPPYPRLRHPRDQHRRLHCALPRDRRRALPHHQHRLG